MVNQRYRKGYRFEIRVKRYFERLGYKVFRLAGSKPLDLIALSKNEIYLIECKTGRVTKKSREKLLMMIKDLNVKPIIAYRDDKNKIRFIDVREDKEIVVPAAYRLI